MAIPRHIVERAQVAIATAARGSSRAYPEEKRAIRGRTAQEARSQSGVLALHTRSRLKAPRALIAVALSC